MPVDAHAAAAGLRRRIAHTRKRRRVTLAVAASVVVAVAVTAAGGLARCRPGGRPGGEPGRGCRARVPCRVRQLRRRQSDQLPDRRCHRPALGHPRAAPPGLRPLPGPGLSGDGNDCEQVGNSESGVSLVCAFDMHGIKSDEIGLGPYIDNYWNLTVRDVKIDSAYQRMAYLSNGFSKQMWGAVCRLGACRTPGRHRGDVHRREPGDAAGHRGLEPALGAAHRCVCSRRHAIPCCVPRPARGSRIRCSARFARRRKPESATRSKRSRTRRINGRSSRCTNASCEKQFPSCARFPCPRPFAGPTRDERSRSWRSSANLGGSIGRRRTRGSRRRCCSAGFS
jgi:hypothetical protein